MSSTPADIIGAKSTHRSSPSAANRSAQLAVIVGIAATLAVSGLVHAYLYVHGYQYIRTIGAAFLLQGSVFCALAVLVLLGGPAWLRWAGGALSVAALIAFALSRTTGLVGFTEHGWESPYGPAAVIAEALTVVLVAVSVLSSRRRDTTT
jgi:peptidoglycan/LPS O-acetylase OafA/YrhL